MDMIGTIAVMKAEQRRAVIPEKAIFYRISDHDRTIVKAMVHEFKSGSGGYSQ